MSLTAWNAKPRRISKNSRQEFMASHSIGFSKLTKMREATGGLSLISHCAMLCFSTRNALDDHSSCNAFFILEIVSTGDAYCRMGNIEPSWIAQVEDSSGTVDMYTDVL